MVSQIYRGGWENKGETRSQKGKRSNRVKKNKDDYVKWEQRSIDYKKIDPKYKKRLIYTFIWCDSTCKS